MKRELPPWVCTSVAGNSGDCAIHEHDHQRVVMSLPKGLGPFVQLQIAIVTFGIPVYSAPIPYNYSQPSITGANPALPMYPHAALGGGGS